MGERADVAYFSQYNTVIKKEKNHLLVKHSVICKEFMVEVLEQNHTVSLFVTMGGKDTACAVFYRNRL